MRASFKEDSRSYNSGVPVIGAHLKLLNFSAPVIREAESDEQGSFILGDIDPGEYRLRAEEPTFVSVIMDVSVSAGQQRQVTLQFVRLVSVVQAITVVASVPSLLTPDPAQSIVIHDQVLDANPGRPGAPISIPGVPIETASGGIKGPSLRGWSTSPIRRLTSETPRRASRRQKLHA
jgi:Carboxypeptidase regulatory-like domain